MPRKDAQGSTLASIAIRTKTDLKLRLEAAAYDNRRSVGRECEARLLASFDASADVRTIIREEIRAALADADEAKRQRLLAGFSGSNSGTALNSLQQLYVNAALSGKQ